MLFSVCLTELSPIVEQTHQPHPGFHWLQSSPTSLCILPLVLSFSYSLQTPAGDHGELQIGSLRSSCFVCSFSLHFPYSGRQHSSISPAAPPLRILYKEQAFFSHSHVYRKRDVFSHELFDMQYSHSFCSEKFTLNRMA